MLCGIIFALPLCAVLGYVISSLLGIIFAIPFCARVIQRNETGMWETYFVAFYYAYLEIYLGNAFLGKSNKVNLIVLQCFVL